MSAIKACVIDGQFDGTDLFLAGVAGDPASTRTKSANAASSTTAVVVSGADLRAVRIGCEQPAAERLARTAVTAPNWMGSACMRWSRAKWVSVIQQSYRQVPLAEWLCRYPPGPSSTTSGCQAGAELVRRWPRADDRGHGGDESSLPSAFLRMSLRQSPASSSARCVVATTSIGSGTLLVGRSRADLFCLGCP